MYNLFYSLENIFFFFNKYFFKIDDFRKLHDIAKQGKTIAVVGGGFLGSELACALAAASRKVK